MNTSDAGNQSQVSLIKTFGPIVGGIGGIAGLTWLAGYLIIESFLVEINLWGMVQFPLGFYKHALVQFIIDGLKAYCEIWPQLLICGITVVFVYLWHIIGRKKSLQFKIIGIGIIGIGAIITFILVTGIETIPADFVRPNPYTFIIYVFLVPVFFGIIGYLILSLQRPSNRVPFRYQYGISIGLGILLFLLIPILYGKNVFTISIYEVVDLISQEASFVKNLSKGDLPDSSNNEDYDSKYNAQNASGIGTIKPSTYVLGNTVNREIFLTMEAADVIYHQVFIDKKAIKGLKINNSITHDLRKYFIDSKYLSNKMARSDLSSLPLDFFQEQELSEYDAHVWENGITQGEELLYEDTIREQQPGIPVEEIIEWEQTGSL